MHIPMDEIFAFHARRTQTHIDVLNYFAGLLGHQFPEHDNDKLCEPYRTGYAYRNYAHYHPDMVTPTQWNELFWGAHDEHHRMAAHHIEHYASVTEIPDIRLIEMVCDWFSANYEEVVLGHDEKYPTVTDFWNAQMSDLDWNPHQRELILNTIADIEHRADYNIVRAMWSGVQD